VVGGVPLQKTKTTGHVMLDQLVTIDYNARGFQFVETISSGLLQYLLSITALIFQPNNDR
jgi:mRNA interferase MazF